MSWQLTAGLSNLRNQVNRRWPNRDHASDGTIGDAAHQAETSGHNPDDTSGSDPEWNGDPDSTPEVRAWDMDSDLGQPGTTAQMVVDHLIRLPGLGSVLRYIIFSRRIYRASTGFAPEEYTGPSAHTEHIHFSGAYTQAADNNTTFDFKLEEVGDMALTKEDLGTLVHTDGVLVAPAGSKNADGSANTNWTLESYLTGTYGAAVSARTYAAEAKDDTVRIEAMLTALDAKLTQVAAGVGIENAEHVPTVGEIAAAVAAALPSGSDPVTREELEAALRGVFASLGQTA